MAERGKSRSRLEHTGREFYDLAKFPTGFYEPKTLAAMDQAFAAIWNVLRADDPFRDYANDSELRIVIGQKLLNLAADGVTDPVRLRSSPSRACFSHTTEKRLPPMPRTERKAHDDPRRKFYPPREHQEL